MLQVIKAITEALECECQLVELKSVLRVFEKVVNNSILFLILPLSQPARRHLLPDTQVFLDYAGDFSLVTDLLRVKIFVTSLMAMATVIRALTVHPDIFIIKIKNRVGESRRLLDINMVTF